MGAPPQGAVEGAWAPGVVDQGGLSDAMVAGTLNGVATDIASVTIENWGKDFKWSFSDEMAPSVCGYVSGDNSVEFRSQELVEGTFTKAYETEVDFDAFHSYYVYTQADGSPFSVNTDWEATIVVTDVQENVGEDAFGSPVGRADGYVQIAFQDGKTAIAGAFSADVCQK